MSEMRRNVTTEQFEKAFLEFMNQADKNALSGKSEGKQAPFGLSDHYRFDGANLHQHFGQGAASKTPYMNWWVVSIYYIVETGGIFLGIEEKRYSALNSIQVKPISLKKIGKKNVNVVVYYEATKETVNFSELYERFLKVCEEVMRLGLHGENDSNGWYPSLSEYDPKITKEQWLDFFYHSGLFNENYKHFLSAMYTLSGQATCSALAEQFGNTAAHYNMTATHIAEHAQEFLKCELFTENGTIRYWPILFFGKKADTRDAGSFIWKMRDPLMEALKEYGIEKITIKTGGETHMKNMILYGPPGTGKTFSTVFHAVAICENKEFDTIKAEALEDYASVKERYEKYVEEGRICFTTFHQSYGYEEFIEGIKPNTKNGDLSYSIEDGVFKAFCQKARGSSNADLAAVDAPATDLAAIKKTFQDDNYVFIIDEINRGNISKIFGELITLIEDTKRKGEEDEQEARLPYSGDLFSVPNNVYILGTMNTADRSIALMDTALRRRFQFIEMMPDDKALEEMGVSSVSIDGETLDVIKMLNTINGRITVLYDREHTIGHAFFKDLKDKPTIATLHSIFETKIIPLLQEYFYEDYSKIQLVLADNAKSSNEYKFVLDSKVTIGQTFKGNADEILNTENELVTYKIQKEAFDKIQSYVEIYG